MVFPGSRLDYSAAATKLTRSRREERARGYNVGESSYPVCDFKCCSNCLMMMIIHSSFADVCMGHRIASCNATQSTTFYWQVDNRANKFRLSMWQLVTAEMLPQLTVPQSCHHLAAPAGRIRGHGIGQKLAVNHWATISVNRAAGIGKYHGGWASFGGAILCSLCWIMYPQGCDSG